MNAVGLIELVFALIMALTLHEFAHALAGEWLGDHTARQEGRLSLNPLKHIDPIMTVLLPAALIIFRSPVVFGAARPVPFNPWAVRYGKLGAALIAAAGPAMNLLLAVVFALWLRFFPVGTDLVSLFVVIITINISFMMFNLIPIPPLDGSRIVYAAVPPLRNLFDTLERHGLAVVFLLLLIAGPIIIPIIGNLSGAMLQLLVPGLTGLST
ncbi:MAG TPA: site-2 protease family protein [Candidatus Saccharimonadales bacterium]|nr:site-2 protease family protein [Candidatus Saccharimonadales bacterium]